MAEDPLTPEGQEPEQPDAAASGGGEATPGSSSGSQDSAEGMAEEALQAAQDALSGIAAGDAGDQADEDPAAADFLKAVQAAVDEAESGVASAGESGDGHDFDELAAEVASTGGSPLDLPAFGDEGAEGDRHGIDLLRDVNLNVKIELGRTRMLVEDVLRLGHGSVVELDKLAGDPVDVYVNDRPVARGEVLVLNDNFCVRISEIIKSSGDPADA